MRPRRHLARLAAVALPVAVGLLGVACSEGNLEDVNHLPVILSVSFSPNPVLTNNAVSLRAEAVDEDADPISYFWSSPAGDFDAITGQTVIWNAPSFGGTYDIILTASDRISSATTRIRIRVTPDQFGGDFTINSNPVGAEIIVDGQNTLFRTPHTFPGLQVGEYVLSLNLPGRLLFPDTALVLVREAQDTTATFNFVTTNKISPLTSGDEMPPQINRTVSWVAWADNSLGPYEIYWNPRAAQENQATRLKLFGWDGDAYYPNWTAEGTQGRIIFQTSIEDTGATLFDVPTSGGLVRAYELLGDARRPTFANSGAFMAFVRHEKDGATFRTSLMEARDLIVGNPMTATEIVTLLEFESTAGRIELSTPMYSSDPEELLIYSKLMPNGTEDVFVYDRVLGIERQLTSAGTRSWPAFGRAEGFVYFEKTDGEGGVFGAALDTDTWTLGRPMQIAPAGARTPSFAWTTLGNTKRLVYLTAAGVIVADNFAE